MSRPRDSQRSKVYKAEEEFRCRLDGRNRHYQDIHIVRIAVDHIINSRWWCLRFPNVKQVLVQDGRGRRYPCGGLSPKDSTIGQISLPRTCRHQLIVLHELAHIVASADEPWHGPDFVRCYLALADEHLEEMAGLAFRWFLAKNRVKWEEPA